MLVIFEPKALPIPMPVLPCQLAIAEINISGIDVAIATTVKPTINAGTPKLRAVAAAPKTKRSAAHANTAIPTTTAQIDRSI